MRNSIKRFINRLLLNLKEKRKLEIRNQLSKLLRPVIPESTKTPRADNGLENSGKQELIENREFYRNSLPLKPLPMMIDFPKFDPTPCLVGIFFGKVYSLTILIFLNY